MNPIKIQKTVYVRASCLPKDVDLVLLWQDDENDLRSGMNTDRSSSSSTDEEYELAWKVCVNNFEMLVALCGPTFPSFCLIILP